VIALVLASVVVSGTASWMPEKYGDDYLALPQGPGHTVTICAKRCLTMTSNDAGPDKAMQRRGRVADIGVKAWEHICGVPRSRGLCHVRITYGRSGPAITPPPTDTVWRPVPGMIPS
jgi:hypothetical protein